MEKALLIAEKPSLRRTIEDVYNKHKSEIPYEITFMEQRGHLLTLMYPDEIDDAMKEWSWDTLPFHPEEHGGWKYKVIKEKKEGTFLTAAERFRQIRDALDSGSYDIVINAGDPDQEGELLIRIVLAALRNKLPVKRYWSNDTTEPKVLEALQNLRDDDHDPMLVNLLAAAYGRQHSDYRFGMNVSRAATLKMGTNIACGRVKTPILAIVCRREKEIENFKPTTCYGIQTVYQEGFTGQYFNPSAVSAEDEESEKDKEQSGTVWFDTREEAEEFLKILGNKAIVSKYEKKKVESYAPKLLKLATAQIAAGKYGLTSAQTLDIIQSLYEKGFLSYPRTDCEYISSGENLTAMIHSASCVPQLKPFIDLIAPSAIGKVRKTKKWVNDAALKQAGHSALVPTTNAPDYESLSREQKIVYSIICRQFIAIFLPPLVQNKVSLVTDINGNAFRSSGKTLVDPGFTKIFGTKFTDVAIPPHSKGDVIDVDRCEITEKTSVCPKRFTDYDLIALCEAPQKYLDDKRLKSLGKRLMIGTPATRSAIITELIEKNKYLKIRKDGKTDHVVPTEIGMQIWENLKDLDICKVDMTGEWEVQLEKVRNGELSLKELEAGMKTSVEQLINNIKENSDMTKIARVSSRTVICKCPKCGGDIISSSRSFYCTNYKTKGCKIGAFKKICDTTIKDCEFLDLLAGKTLVMSLQKGDKKWKQQVRYDFDQAKVVFVEDVAHESSYACPKCGAPLDENLRMFSCSKDCGFKLWKTSCGKMLTKEQISSFFKNGDTGLVTGMVSRAGKMFSAHLVLNEDKTGAGFRFDDSKKKSAS